MIANKEGGYAKATGGGDTHEKLYYLRGFRILNA